MLWICRIRLDVGHAGVGWGGVGHAGVVWSKWFMKSTEWSGSCRGGVGHAVIEWGKSYRGEVVDVEKQPKE